MPAPERPSLAETVLLGLLHGPAELLPVSSSAHVALVPQLLGWRHARLPGDARKEVEVALHAGSLLALLGTVPLPTPGQAVAATAVPALAGALLERPIEERLGTPRSLAAGLLAGAIAMALADRRPQRAQRLGLRAAAIVGTAQAAALAPGVSRHGAALTAARALAIPRTDAHMLSLQAGLPVLAGATALKVARVASRGGAPALVAGAVASYASTRASRRLLRAAAPGPLWPFAAYRAGLAALTLAARRRPAS
jgi:undecaprenyl-diphosphatase